MKQKWNNENIKQFFEFVAKDLQNNVPVVKSFEKYAKICGKKALSLRNFYYNQLKIFFNNKNLASEMGINLSLHKVQVFRRFDALQEAELKNKIDCLLKQGYSVRKACAMISDGNIQQMLRLQNKYRSLCKKQNYFANNDVKHNTKKASTSDENCKVLQFPGMGAKPKKQHLSDEDINNLFMGLVRIVKENAVQDSGKKVQSFLEQAEMQKRKELVLLRQKQLEIDILKQEVVSLRQKKPKFKRKTCKLQN